LLWSALTKSWFCEHMGRYSNLVQGTRFRFLAGTGIFLFVTTLATMLDGSLVTTAWRVLRLRMEETPSSFGG
jgi:hypothetical protein